MKQVNVLTSALIRNMYTSKLLGVQHVRQDRNAHSC